MRMFACSITALVVLIALPWKILAQDDVREFRKRSAHKAMEISESDIEAEIQFGKELAARILGRFRMDNDEKTTRYVNLIGRGLAAYTGRTEIEFRFAILNTDIINAFAAPGGYIFVTKGALRMMENEAQLAGVLAHEIAHVTEKHIVRELNIRGGDESPLVGFASILGGGTAETMRAAFTQLVDRANEILFEKGLKKEDELEADRLAVMLIGNAGYSPSSYRDFLEKISKTEKSGTKIVRDTHPSYEERIESIEKFLEEEGLDALNYAEAKERFYEYVIFKK